MVIEESQVHGPAEMREAHYTAESGGPIGVYDVDDRSHSRSGAAVELTFPRPEPVVVGHVHDHDHGYYYGSEPRTAPVSRVRFEEDERRLEMVSRVVVIATCKFVDTQGC